MVKDGEGVSGRRRLTLKLLGLGIGFCSKSRGGFLRRGFSSLSTLCKLWSGWRCSLRWEDLKAICSCSDICAGFDHLLPWLVGSCQLMRKKAQIAMPWLVTSKQKQCKEQLIEKEWRHSTWFRISQWKKAVLMLQNLNPCKGYYIYCLWHNCNFEITFTIMTSLDALDKITFALSYSLTLKRVLCFYHLIFGKKWVLLKIQLLDKKHLKLCLKMKWKLTNIGWGRQNTLRFIWILDKNDFHIYVTMNMESIKKENVVKIVLE